DRQSGPRQGRQLKTKRFAPARRQKREDILSVQRVANDFLLQRTKRSEAEILLQQRKQWRHVGYHEKLILGKAARVFARPVRSIHSAEVNKDGRFRGSLPARCKRVRDEGR